MNSMISHLRRSFAAQLVILTMILPGLAFFPVNVSANPTGGIVVNGNVNFSGGAGTLNIHQKSNLAIINWQDFSINAGELTRFNQPGKGAIALNRVVGGNLSTIAGQLRGNGGVMVINPNGVLVTGSGVIDVGGLLTLSTLEISNRDFLNGGANRFRGTTSAGVSNYGAISAGGDVVLLGNFLQNAGSVSAPDGVVAFGAGGDILVDQTASGATISVLSGGAGGATGIENTGSINGAAAELKAHGNVYALAIKNDGLVRASGYNFKGGKLTLNAGSGGSLVNTGGLYAQNRDGSGGQISINGAAVNIASGTVDASATNGSGGAVAINGSSVSVGSTATVISNGDSGGSVRINGGNSLDLDGAVNAIGNAGRGGDVTMTATEINLSATANSDVSGVTQGGSLRIGGGFQGKDDDVDNAANLRVQDGATLAANATVGNAGTVILWSDVTTSFSGGVSAQSVDGNGGFIEISGGENLGFYGDVNTLSQNGANGMLLLDPGSITVNNTPTTPGAAGANEVINSTDLTNALATSDVVLFTDGLGTGEILINDNLIWNSAASLSIIGHGDILISADIQNAGTGDVNVAAGWNDTIAPLPAGFTPPGPGGANGSASQLIAGGGGALMATFMDDLEGNPAGYGNGGTVIVNALGTQAVSVGSANGETNVFGDAVVVIEGFGNDRPTQIGYRTATDNPTGNINVIAKSDIVLSAAETSPTGRNDSHVIIGHGGSNDPSWQAAPNRTGNGDLSGDIRVIAGGGLTMKGSNDRSFSQIGHGGHAIVGDKDGNITVIAEYIEMLGGYLPGSVDATNRAGTRIGHGGTESPGTADLGANPNGVGYSGDIYVKSRTQISGQTSNEVTNGNGANYWQIGHGGYRSGVVGTIDGNGRPSRANVLRQTTGTGLASDQQISYTMEGHTGAIYVEAETGSIVVFAGPRSQGIVRIGHGGRESHGNHALEVLSTVTAETAGLKDGITIRAQRDLILDRFVHPSVARPSDDSMIHIGLGGNRAGGRFVGDIDIEIGGDFEMHGGDNLSYAKVGHGGFADAGTWNTTTLNVNNGHATLSGDIRLVAGGDVKMFAGGEEGWAFAQIGHGGAYRTADGLDALGAVIGGAEAGHHGNILIDSGGDVVISSKPDADADYNTTVGGAQNFALIGHGGYRSNGDHYGTIDVAALGDIQLEAGYGGYEEYRAGANGVDDDYDSSQTGDANFAQIGHGGFASTLYRLNDASSGYQWNGNGEGKGIGSFAASDITITAGGDFNIIATDQIGAPRNDQTLQYDFNDLDFDTSILTIADDGADVTITTAAGHGLVNGDVIVINNVEGGAPVTATVSGVTATSFVLVGVGNGAIVDTGADGTFGRAVTTVQDDGTDVTFTTAFAHGFTTGQGVIFNNFEGTAIVGSKIIEVIDANTFIVRGIGDGTVVDADMNGQFDAAEERPIIGRTIRGWARVGHGGYGDNDNERRMTLDSITTGDISIDIGGSLTMRGGGQEQKDSAVSSGAASGVNRIEYSPAQIGHGGNFFRSSYDGSITIHAGVDVDVEGGKAFREWARIGHGGYESGITPNDIASTTVTNAEIIVYAGRDVRLVGGAGVNNLAGGNIQFDQAQIGHGGGNMGFTVTDQNITVAANRDLIMSGGSGIRDAYSQIGHGALNNGDGDFSGVIDVTAGRHIGLTRTSGTDIDDGSGNGTFIQSVRNYAKIGHGDTDSAGRTKSQGEWNGNIFVRAGQHLTSVGGMIGHPDPTNGDGIIRSLEGNTYIAVSRANPYVGGGGNLRTDADTRFTSALYGSGTELRLYMPESGGVDNFIAEGTRLNNASYTRTPFPNGTRADETISPDHTLTTGAEGQVTGTFLLDGAYPGHGFGLYNIYYSIADPNAGVVPPVTPPPVVPPVIIPDFPFGTFLFSDLFDTFDRAEEQFAYDGYEGQLFSLSPDEASEEGVPAKSFIEMLLDGNLGDGEYLGSDEEESEEEERKKRRAGRKVGASSLVYYTYSPGTNRYSSYRVFGGRFQ